MIVKAPAKINLGLHIKRKREDGFHELESVFHSIPLVDYIELIPAEVDSFKSYGLEIPGNPETNLCLQALHVLREQGYNVPPYEIHLLKNIPIGAGLGGGSSDAVAVLKAVNALQSLRIKTERLVELSALLGSDCPFFCYDSAAKVTGRGEYISPIDWNMRGMYLLLVHPNLHISTKEAYQSLDLAITTKDEIKIPAQYTDWAARFINDFEKALWTNYPQLKEIKEKLQSSGAFYASMSGSGSSVFGVFKEKPTHKLFIDEGFSEWILEL